MMLPETVTDAMRETAMANLKAHRRLRESAQESWERTIVAAVAMGHSLREVADAAGISHTQVKRYADACRVPTSD